MDDEKLDWASMERELQAAVAADAKYQRENDAKLRAITQKVGSFEEFRDIVLASHLRPLETRDKVALDAAARTQRWNAFATNDRDSDEKSPPETSQPPADLPRTALEFNRDWRLRCRSPASRYELLLRVGWRRAGELFRAEVGCAVLGEATAALAERFREEDAAAVADLLAGFAETPRFGLAVRFLGAAELEAARELCRRLEAACERRRPEAGRGGAEALESGDGQAEREEGGEVAGDSAPVGSCQGTGEGVGQLTAKPPDPEGYLTLETVRALRKAFGIE